MGEVFFFSLAHKKHGLGGVGVIVGLGAMFFLLLIVVVIVRLGVVFLPLIVVFVIVGFGAVFFN